MLTTGAWQERLLAHSRRAFLVVKAANLVVGLLVGYAAMAMGF